jgi:hypothetical protein
MSVSNAFTAAGFGTGLLVEPGQSVTYEVSGTFTGQCFLERLIGGVSVVEIAATIADTALAEATYLNITRESQHLRWRSAIATGTATAVIDEVVGEALLKVPDIFNRRTGALLIGFRDDGVNIPNPVGAQTVSTTPVTTEGIGAPNGATVAAVETGNGIVHKTVLTLTVTPITLTDDAGVGQFGGVKIYDFPAGNILVLGAVIDAIITLLSALWIDAATGDVALGSGVPADATALDATAVDMIQETAIAAMVAQVGPIDAQKALAAIPLGSAGGTDDDVNLNVRIDDDAAHVTDSGTITGTVTIHWVNLGDF